MMGRNGGGTRVKTITGGGQGRSLTKDQQPFIVQTVNPCLDNSVEVLSVIR